MKKKIDTILGYFLVLLLAVMTLDVLWGVATRYLYGSQADWTEELARYLLIWIGILGAAYASGRQMHLAIDLIKPKLRESSQIYLAGFVYGIVLLFALFVMVVGGIRLMYISHTLGQISAAMRIPITAVYMVIPLSGFLVVYYKVHALLNLKNSQQIES